MRSIAGPDGQFDLFPFAGELMQMVLADYPETLPAHGRGRSAARDRRIWSEPAVQPEVPRRAGDYCL